MKIMIVDGNSILNRAYYGIRMLTAKDGTPTNAIYGFLNIFNKYFTEQQPDCVAVCFDVSRKTFRHDIYSEYKGTRKGMDDELRVQLPLIKDILSALGYKVIGLENYEADDLIGTLSTNASLSGNSAVIITGDRDSLQLVDENVTVLLPSTKMGKTETTVYTPQKVLEEKGVRPDQIVDLKALMGDTSDNIPGVKGIGEKTAADLISRFETLDGLYSGFEESDLRPLLKEKLRSGKNDAELSRELATINRNAPIELCCENYKIGKIDTAKASSLLLRLGLFSFMEKFNLSASDAEEIEEETEKEYKFNLKRISRAEEIEKGEPLFYIERGSLIYAVSGDTVYILPDTKGVFEEKREKCTFDAKSQYLFALKEGYTLNNITFDIKLGAYLLEPTASSYEISELCVRLGEPKISCEYIPEFGEDESAISDVLRLPYLYEKIKSELEKKEMLSLLCDIELPLSETLSLMEFEGFSVDRDGICKFDAELSSALCELRERIWELAGCEFNLNSPKQLGEILFEKLSLPPAKKTKTGYSTNAEVLESLKNEHPIINDILEYRKVAKLKSTYTEGLLSKISTDGRIHTTFLQTETRTGRLSSIEPNLQNIPVRTELGARLREFFVAKEGYMLVDADYSQIELRVLAHASDDKAMQEAFANGVDIHTSTAAKIHNLPIDFVTPEMRRGAKAVNFGIVYGIGAYSLSQDLSVSVAEASRLIKSYLASYSGVAEYMDKIISEGEKTGYVKTLYNRIREIPELKNKNKVIHALGERIAKNTPIQGTAADIIKIAMNRVSRRLRREMPDSHLILQVHDELICECPEKDAEKVLMILSEEMERSADLKVRLETDVHIGKNWLIAKG